MNDHRATRLLNQLMKTYPHTPKLVDVLLSGRGYDLPDWSGWCFVPMSGWFYMVNHVVDVARLAALGTWRYSQGVYRFDSALFDALIDSPVTGELPSNVFTRLPEWCVYVETPGYLINGVALHGFWAHMEWDVNEQRKELRLLLDAETGLNAYVLHIGRWSVSEAIGRVLSESDKQAKALGVSAPQGVGASRADTEWVGPLLSLLLYLCSDEPDVDDERLPGTTPARAERRHTKKGWRMFAANKTKVWTVGGVLGEQLRRDGSEDGGDPSGRAVRAHLRRGHWHGYWTGPRDGERVFSYRWLPPFVVGAKRQL